MKRFLLVLLVGAAACSAPPDPRTGAEVYGAYCTTCHQADGGGISGAFPPLTRTRWVLGDEGRLVRLVLGGMQGPVEVLGESYNNAMPHHRFLDDAQIAAVLTFVRSNFGNDAPAIDSTTVARVRATFDRPGMWIPDSLEGATGVP